MSKKNNSVGNMDVELLNLLTSPMHNKAEVIERLKQHQYGFSQLAKISECEDESNISVDFNNHIAEIYGIAITKIENIDLPSFSKSASNAYDLELDCEGLTLNINHYDNVWKLGGRDKYHTDITFSTKLYNAAMLTVNEYAEMRGVQAVTIRQWIRRGKIRNAIKTGSEWLISELTMPYNTRGYSAGRYYWNSDIAKFSDEFGFLRSFNGIIIEQCPDDKDKFIVEALKNDDGERIEFGKEVKEKLERYLISNPNVKIFEPYLLPPFNIIASKFLKEKVK